MSGYSLEATYTCTYMYGPRDFGRLRDGILQKLRNKS